MDHLYARLSLSLAAQSKNSVTCFNDSQGHTNTCLLLLHSKFQCIINTTETTITTTSSETATTTAAFDSNLNSSTQSVDIKFTNASFSSTLPVTPSDGFSWEFFENTLPPKVDNPLVGEMKAFIFSAETSLPINWTDDLMNKSSVLYKNLASEVIYLVSIYAYIIFSHNFPLPYSQS
ncbi:unnamed protein product [Trichobilharzia regenti]|nr:unnamed protein product [Trichobilharzia regenti]